MPLADQAPVYFVGVTHFLNVILMVFLVRSGLEILASYPLLYLRDDCKPGTEWLKLSRKEIERDRTWITLELESDWSPWIALPGRKNLGLGRLWHFVSLGLWFLNGLV